MDKGKYKVKKGGKFFPLYVWTKGDKEIKKEKNVFYLYFIWFAKEIFFFFYSYGPMK